MYSTARDDLTRYLQSFSTFSKIKAPLHSLLGGFKPKPYHYLQVLTYKVDKRYL